tara:strand:+ start:2738 stop:3718 length:981 start_codon:yes stop_codon:yes gene_type:complete
MNVNNKSIKLGLIGLGNWAKEAYLPILLGRDDVEILAVSARTNKTLDIAKNIINKDIKLFNNYKDLIEQSDIEAVFIGIPHTDSAQVVIDSIENDKHVFVEPPLYFGDKYDYINNLVTSKNKAIHIDVELNFLPVILKCKEIVDSGDLGKTLSSKIELKVDWSSELDFNIEQMKNYVIELSTWYVPVTDMFTSADIEYAKYINSKNNFDIGSIEVKYENGYIGEWKFNLKEHPGMNLTFEILFENGFIKCDLSTGDLTIIDENKNETTQSIPAKLPVFAFAGMQESVDMFLNSIKTKSNTFDLNKYKNIKDIHSKLYSYCELTEPI